jgi:hypothetical protein
LDLFVLRVFDPEGLLQVDTGLVLALVHRVKGLEQMAVAQNQVVLVWLGMVLTLDYWVLVLVEMVLAL